MILKRFTSTDLGTFGVLSVDNHQFYTVEKPWVNNTPEISCIPDGEYRLEPHSSAKYGNVLCMVNDEGVTHYKEPHSKRYACLIHVANYEKDVIGCIGLGDAYFENMVSNSRKAIQRFYNIVNPKEAHNLTILWAER